jgi:hypothetical protein
MDAHVDMAQCYGWPMIEVRRCDNGNEEAEVKRVFEETINLIDPVVSRKISLGV